MKYPSLSLSLVLAASILLVPVPLALTARTTNPSKVPPNAVLLSKVSTLTLRAGKATSSRRAPAVPQAQCVGPAHVCKLYSVETIRCANAGSDYEQEDVQWTCTASLPEEFKLGSTDVTCEGYESSDDAYVLKGSCGVEYRLLLTEKGEEKYGVRNEEGWGSLAARGGSGGVGQYVFWLIFGGVAAVIFLSAFGCLGRGGQVGGNGNGGDGGNGGGSDDYGPPPPYTSHPPPQKPRASRSTYSSPFSSTSFPASTSGESSRRGESWRPGFWSGALGGAAAGYMAGNRSSSSSQGRNPIQPQPQMNQRPHGQGWFGGGGSSWSGRSGSSSSASPSYSSSRHDSTGFGSTSRR